MRVRALLIAFLSVAGPLAAQEAATPAAPPTEAQTVPAEEPTAQPGREAVAQAAPERKFTGEVEGGYRFVQDVGGTQNIYRSIVNLGEGPKLFSGHASYRNPGGHWMDRLEMRADSWGGEPYNTGRLEADLAGAYNFQLNYRNIAYFNSLPSFADPLAASGLLLSERAFDIRRRNLDTELVIKPGARISPYLAFSHNAGYGTGITTFVTDGNEFPVATGLRDSTESYRGGVHINFTRFHFTLEQGGTTFKDDQQVTFAGRNPGNRTTTLLGQTLVLNNLRQAYGARGSGIYNRALVQGRPWERLRFQGQFLYSQPSIDVRQTVGDRGQFVLLAAAAPYTSLTEVSLGEAQRPRPSGSWSTEFVIHRRLRLLQNWSTDRFHVSGSALLTQAYDTAPITNLTDPALQTLVMNYNQNEVDAIFDVGAGAVLRGGYRYVWGDIRVPTPGVLGSTPPTRGGELRRHVGIAGGSWRFRTKLDVNLDFEGSPGDQTYFRTDLKAYQRARARGRYRFNPSWTFAVSFSAIHNRNDAPTVNLEMRSQQSSFSLMWSPNGGKRFNILADYTRSTLGSDLPFLDPGTQTAMLSHYRDDGHHGGGYAEVHLVRGARLNVGGSYSINTGTRPTRYYQPQAQAFVPVFGKVAWTADWRWYGFTETRYAFENFHTHTFAIGLRLGI